MLLIHCLLLLPLFVGALCLVLVLLFSTLCPSSVALQSPLWGKESWLLYFNCVPDVLWLLVFCRSSLWFHVLIVVFPIHTYFLF